MTYGERDVHPPFSYQPLGEYGNSHVGTSQPMIGGGQRQYVRPAQRIVVVSYRRVPTLFRPLGGKLLQHPSQPVTGSGVVHVRLVNLRLPRQGLSATVREVFVTGIGSRNSLETKMILRSIGGSSGSGLVFRRPSSRTRFKIRPLRSLLRVVTEFQCQRGIDSTGSDRDAIR